MFLQTTRLRLRPFAKSDKNAYFSIQAAQDVRRFLGGTTDREKARISLDGIIEKFDEQGFGILCACDRESEVVLGYAGVQFSDVDDGELIEVVCALLPEARGRKLGFEALQEVLRWSFEKLGFDKVIGLVNIHNRNSKKLATSLGMKFWKKREKLYEETEENIYILTEADWRDRAAESAP